MIQESIIAHENDSDSNRRADDLMHTAEEPPLSCPGLRVLASYTAHNIEANTPSLGLRVATGAG